MARILQSAGAGAMAFGLGPIAGGLISEYFGWNGLFAITCLVLVLLPFLLRLLPKEQPRTTDRFDGAGVACLAFATGEAAGEANFY